MQCNDINKLNSNSDRNIGSVWKDNIVLVSGFYSVTCIYMELVLMSHLLVCPNATQAEVDAALDSNTGNQLFAQDVSLFDVYYN